MALVFFFIIEQNYVAIDQRNFACLENEGITSFFLHRRSWHFSHDLRQTYCILISAYRVPATFFLSLIPWLIQLTVILKWWNVSLWLNFSVLLYISEGRSWQRSFLLIFGEASILNEKHGGVFKQANEHSGMRLTRSSPRAVIFK